MFEIKKESSFDDVYDTQHNFRALMDAMSRPGTIFKLKKHGFSLNQRLFNPNILTVLKTLGDKNVTFCLGTIYDEEYTTYIEINTGMRPVAIEYADYAVFYGKFYDDAISRVNTGTLEFPESSSCVIISVEKILEGAGLESAAGHKLIKMKGPGIKDASKISLTGFDLKFARMITKLNAAFPLGTDVIFAGEDGNIACMPRTSMIEVD